MNVGDLIMVRLGIVANTKTIVPAIILKKFPVDKPPTFEILAMGESWVVTHKDIGPFDA